MSPSFYGIHDLFTGWFAKQMKEFVQDPLKKVVSGVKLVGNTFTKGFGKLNMPMLNSFGRVFKNMASVSYSFMSGIMGFFEKLGVLDPLFEVLGGLLEIFGAILLEKLMPSFEELFEILLSDESMELIEALAELLYQLIDVFIQIAIEVLPDLIPALTDLVYWLIEISPLLNSLINGLLLLIGVLFGSDTATSELVKSGLILIGWLEDLFDWIVEASEFISNLLGSGEMGQSGYTPNSLVGGGNDDWFGSNFLQGVGKIGFASGGIITRSTAGVMQLGETSPEIIANVSQVGAFAEAIRGGSSDVWQQEDVKRLLEEIRDNTRKRL